jgi:hypothetical protein
MPLLEKATEAGAVSEFYSEGCELASEGSQKFFTLPWHFWHPPAGWCELAQGGAKEETKYI